jgi:hypothetical protein
MIQRINSLAHPEPAHRRLFALMGEQVWVESNHPAVMQAAQEAFGRFPPAAQPGGPPLLIRLFIEAPPGGGSPGFERERPQLSQPRYHSEGHLFSIHLGAHNLAVADARQGFAFGYLTPEVAGVLPFLRVTFLEALALAMLGPARGYVAIHAAGVVKNGAALLLHAPAGTGKSTLAYACARRGFQILAEDAVHLSTSAQPPRLYGLPWQLRLLPDAGRFFPELAGLRPNLQINGEWKLEIDLEARFPGAAITCAAPAHLVLLERSPDGSPTRLEPLPRAEARACFSLLWPWNSGWSAAMEAAGAGLLERPVYRLRMNGSPDQAAEALAPLLEAGVEAPLASP